MEWCEIELPVCLKKILSTSAYDCANSLRLLDAEKVAEIERYVSEFGRCVIDELNCCHSETYKKQKIFKFLPGHRAILMSLPSCAQKNINNDQKLDQLKEKNSDVYSVFLTQLIETAQINAKKPKNKAIYSDIIRNFSTLIYLMSGRACYEVLHRNLPIPSTKTVCECI